MTPKPNIGRPYRWRGHKLRIVPEVGNPDNACTGCVSEEEREDSKEFFELCEIRGKNDCSGLADGNEQPNEHIFIKDTKAAIAAYIARRIEG